MSGLPGRTHNELERLLSHYCGCESFPDLADPGNLEQIIEDLLKQIWKDKGITGEPNAATARYFAEQLWKAVQEGFEQEITEVDFDTPDYRMLANLQRDIVHFSSAKDYAMQRAMASELIDEDGKLRSWTGFRNAAYGVADTHVHSWLRTEYDTAIAGAQMAGKWQQIKQEEGLFPLLQFDAVIDKNTTHLCRSLDGVIRPVNDPFWDEYYPPNHFGCRSTVRQLDDGDPTPVDQIEYPEKMPELFKVNLGKQGLAFPPDHPYYDGLPDDYGQLKGLRHMALETARDKYAGQEREMDQIGNVQISWQGLKEMANQPHGDKIAQLQLMQVLPQLMDKAKHVKSTADEKSKQFKAFHFFDIPGLDDMFLVVKERLDGTSTIYSIVDRLR